MFSNWDRLQDLRGGKSVRSDSEVAKAVIDPATIEKNTDKIQAYRVGLQEGKRMSLLGRLAHLTEDAEKFNQETVDVLDGIGEKIASARRKRDVAKDKHHGYYDGIIKGVEESVTVIDRLSNGPLSEGGGS